MSQKYQLPTKFGIRNLSEKFAEEWKKACPHSALQGEQAENLFLAAAFPAFHAAPHELNLIAGADYQNAGQFFRLSNRFWERLRKSNGKGRAKLAFALWAMETTAKDGPLVWIKDGQLWSTTMHTVNIFDTEGTVACPDFQDIAELAERWAIAEFTPKDARNALADMRKV